MLRVAPEAKAEVDALAQRIASEFGGQVATARSRARRGRSRRSWPFFGGDASRIKDLARNTIIVGEGDIPAVVARLEAAGAKVKTVSAATDPLGYSGVNATIATRSGLTAEVQVNTAKMIFAKESTANAPAILGEATYDSIARETGMEGDTAICSTSNGVRFRRARPRNRRLRAKAGPITPTFGEEKAMEKGEFFAGVDRYIRYDFEDVMFHWDHRQRVVRMKFVGDDHETQVPHDQRLINDAILGGREITREEFQKAG